eukprot:1593757-Pyramimonas_sp.AAC.1
MLVEVGPATAATVELISASTLPKQGCSCVLRVGLGMIARPLACPLTSAPATIIDQSCSGQVRVATSATSPL